MTVNEIRELLHDLPGEMEVMLGTMDGAIASVCRQNSKVLELKIADDEEEFDYANDTFVNDFLNEIGNEDFEQDEDEEYEDEDLETVEILLLVPCNGDHGEELEEGEINSQPQLN